MTGNRLWTVGAVVVILAVVIMGWFLLISPSLTQAGASESQAQGIAEQNTASEASIAELQAQFKNLPTQEAKLAALQTAVPDNSDLDDFLDQLEDLATSTGVTITTFTAAEAAAYGGTAGAAAAAATPTPSASADPNTTQAPTALTGGALAGKLFVVPISLGITGPPDGIMAFVNAAQTGPRFFLVTAASYSGGGGTASGTLSGQIFVVRESSTPPTDSTESTTPKATPTPSVAPTPSTTSAPLRTGAPTPTATPAP